MRRPPGRSPPAHPAQAPLAGYPLIHELDASKGGRAGAWHTDVSFTDRPPAFSILRAVEIPPVGGDTVWSNTVSDNRATQHYAINDYADSPRIVHRVTVAGTIPVGKDGRPSVSRAGDAGGYSPIGTVPAS